MKQNKFNPEQMAKLLETFPVALENIKDGSQFIFQKSKVVYSELNKPRREYELIGMRQGTLNGVHTLTLIYDFKGLDLEISKTEKTYRDRDIFEVTLGKNKFECFIKILV